jgi:H+-transporting ATPase
MLTWTLNKVSKNFEQVFLFTVGFLATGLFVTSPFLILVMVFANDFVSMSVGTDNARISPAPDRWNVREIAEVAAVVGGCWLALSFTLLWWSLEVAHLALAPLQTFFFVYLVFSSQGTILLVRERGHAWSSRPSRVLLLAIGADGLAVTALAVTGTLMAPISPLLILLLLGAVALTALLVDQVKVWFIRRTGAFGEGSRFGIPRKAPVS